MQHNSIRYDIYNDILFHNELNKLLDSNLTSTVEEKDRRTTYTWNYTLNKLDSIHIKFRVTNFVSIIMIISGVIDIYWRIYFYKKKKR